MSKNMNTQKEALAASIEMENKGRDFYIESAEKSANKLTRDVFKYLADEELKHIEAIKQFYDAELSGGKSDFEKVVGSIDLKKANQAIAKLFEGLSAKVPTDKADLDALKFARDFERNGQTFYMESAANTKDPQIKKLFEFLVDEEGRHFKMVDDSMAYLENPEEWFHRREGWHVEG